MSSPTIAAEIDEEWLEALVHDWPGASGGIKPEWEIYVLTVGGKIFGLAHENRARFLLTFKADPLENEALREEFDEVIPGYHMNKRHWSSLVLGGSRLPVSLVSEFVRGSYEIVFASLTKRDQAAITSRHKVTRHLGEIDRVEEPEVEEGGVDNAGAASAGAAAATTNAGSASRRGASEDQW